MRSVVKRGRVPLAFWAVFVALRLVAGGWDVRLGPDDLTRLAQVDALLDGQGWWDLTLHRLGVGGVPMHWTRHVDALFLVLGGGVEAIRPVTLVVLPLLLGLAAFVLVALIAEEVGGRELVPASLLLLLASILTSVQFSPGRVDHHGLQIVLALVAVLGLVRLERPAWALLAGVSLGVSLSVGLEQALVAAGIMVGVALVVIRGRVPQASTDRMALGLVGGAVVGTLGFAPASRLIGVACDVFSAQHLLVVVGAAVGLVVHSRWGRPGWLLLGAWGIAGVAGIAVAPRCVDPYADVAPLLKEAWLPRVSEAEGILGVLQGRPGFALAVLVPAVIAIGYAAWCWAASRWSPGPFGRLVPVLVFGFASAFIQLRSASVATAIGVIALGALFVRLRSTMEGWPMPARASTMALVALVISGIGPFVAGSAMGAETNGSAVAASVGSCAAGLDRIGADVLVVAPMDLGPRLLHETDARVLAGPYHRNGEGNLLAWDLLGSPADGERVTAAGVRWVAICEGIPELAIIEAEFGPGLLADLLDGDVPGFLEPVPSEADGLLLYRVRG